MNLEIRSDGFEGFTKRALARAKKLDAGEKIQPSFGITFESAREMLQLLTVERTRLLETVRTKHLSMSALAVLLKRDPKSVRRDVKKLEEYGIVRLREQINPGHGRVKIVEPVAKKVELRASF
ncbi:HVO_A0114 family putative DNA-binding protein [Terriglobus tenax]|uniref:HVO_A0114 family putative DNA-binding protein n=1 Tax=Terriglobus tenax TaxID=1111115 RepID=UPI0021DF7D4C|nr:hypothetical protein [Terriglobus tenax]